MIAKRQRSTMKISKVHSRACVCMLHTRACGSLARPIDNMIWNLLGSVMIRWSILIEIVITFRSRFQVTGRRPRLARASIVLPLPTLRPPSLAFDFDRDPININFDRDLCNKKGQHYLGKITARCGFCGAVGFEAELKSKGTDDHGNKVDNFGNLCCCKGKVWGIVD